jgi:hypothetical protein
MDRRRSRVSPIFKAAALLALLGAASRANGQTDADKKQAQALQVAGVRLMDHGDNRGALDKFEAAFRLFPSPKILFNMGKARNELGQAADAVNDFERFLDEAPYAQKESRDEAERLIKVLRPQLSYLDLTTDDVGSRITVDGREVGTAPLARPLAVMPGPHEVHFDKAGMLTETRSVAPVAGQKLRIYVKLTPVPSATAAPTPEPAPARAAAAPPPGAPTTSPPVVTVQEPLSEPVATAHRPWQLDAAWIAGGAGVVFLAGGITAQVLASSKNADFNNVTNAPSPNGQCNKSLPNAGGGPCQGLLDGANTRSTIALIGYVASGVALAGALVFYLTAPSPPRPSGHSTAIACLPGIEAPGMSCSLTTRF